MTKVFVPRDAAALSMGADAVAAAIEREAAALGARVEVIRNGSRGMFWLEPLVEVDTARGRIAYGPVQPDDVAGLLGSGLVGGRESALGPGLTRGNPLPKLQGRPTFPPGGRL